MNKQLIIAGASLLLGVVITLTAQQLMPRENRNEYQSQKYDSSKVVHDGTMQGMMEAMVQSLQGKTGDEFDKAFLSEMVVHHGGAVAMAELALQNANHQEIKDLANAIISAQKVEISQMQQWQKAWYNQ